ncbi:hypothetical protein C0J52_09721 [Blattella germanica]|nr:hypothetical protein C0J52_09721 [Blattella germanica]
MDPPGARYGPGGDAPQPLYSARYGTPPPPPPHPRRPYLQFPPPPPYPPPDENDPQLEMSDEDASSPIPAYQIQETHFHRHDSKRNYSPTALSSSLPSHLLHPSNTVIDAHYGAHVEDMVHESHFHQMPNDFDHFIDPNRNNDNLFRVPGSDMDMDRNDNHRLNDSISPHGDIYEHEAAEYSYAYYEPGPPTSHANFLVNNTSCSARTDRNNRHTYVTRYGTEENIYEEISEVAAKCSQLAEQDRLIHHQTQQHRRSHQHHRQNHQSQLSLSQSVVEEEVRRVQSRHRRVLGELNLTVEAMLMPPPPSRDEENGTSSSKGAGPPDLLEDLLMSVGPTDELLSPASCSLGDHDSGFSGSSGTSYGFSGGSSSYNNSVMSGNSLRRHGGDNGARSSQSFPRSVGCPGNPGCSPGYSPLLTRRSGKSGSGYLKFNKAQEPIPSKGQQKQIQPQQQSNNHGFFGRKGWIRLPGFGNNNSQNNKGKC